MNSKLTDDSDMRREYDFSKGIRNKFAFKETKSQSFFKEPMESIHRTQGSFNEGSFDEIRNKLYTFNRKPFKTEIGENEDLDVIINASNGVPVGVVSKSYNFIQHYDLLNAIESSFKNLGFDIDRAELKLSTTKYNERIWLRIKFTDDYTFDPGDGHLLTPKLHVLNSVNGITPLELRLGWYRFICKNGLLCLDNKLTYKRLHTSSLEFKSIENHLCNSIDIFLKEREIYKRWKETRISFDTDSKILRHWIDTFVFKAWRDITSQRVYSILTTARDGKISKRPYPKSEGKKDSYLIRFSSGFDVPGAKPVQNMYDVANALSWVSSHHTSLTGQYRMMAQVPKMLTSLEQLISHRRY